MTVFIAYGNLAAVGIQLHDNAQEENSWTRYAREKLITTLRIENLNHEQ